MSLTIVSTFKRSISLPLQVANPLIKKTNPPSTSRSGLLTNRNHQPTQFKSGIPFDSHYDLAVVVKTLERNIKTLDIIVNSLDIIVKTSERNIGILNVVVNSPNAVVRTLDVVVETPERNLELPERTINSLGIIVNSLGIVVKSLDVVVKTQQLSYDTCNHLPHFSD